MTDEELNSRIATLEGLGKGASYYALASDILPELHALRAERTRRLWRTASVSVYPARLGVRVWIGDGIDSVDYDIETPQPQAGGNDHPSFRAGKMLIDVLTRLGFSVEEKT